MKTPGFWTIVGATVVGGLLTGLLVSAVGMAVGATRMMPQNPTR